MEKVRPWRGEPPDRGRLTNRTERGKTGQRWADIRSGLPHFTLNGGQSGFKTRKWWKLGIFAEYFPHMDASLARFSRNLYAATQKHVGLIRCFQTQQEWKWSAINRGGRYAFRPNYRRIVGGEAILSGGIGRSECCAKLVIVWRPTWRYGVFYEDWNAV